MISFTLITIGMLVMVVGVKKVEGFSLTSLPPQSHLPTSTVKSLCNEEKMFVHSLPTIRVF